MKSKIFALLGLSSALVFTAGCYTTVEGRTKPGMPFVKDSIEGRYERPQGQIFAAARKVLEYKGTLTEENSVTKTLAARVDTRTVRVRVEELEPNLCRVIVQARTKSGMGDVDLAAQIEKEIALQLK
jgi:hypothetical protein